MLTKSFALLIWILIWLPAYTCTVWGVIKPNEILLAKNRDYAPGNQKFISITKKNKYRFFGLYGDEKYNKKYTLRMGINETGLIVFMTFAASLPKEKRQASVSYHQVMENILANYRYVDDIDKDSKRLFPKSTPIHYIFADRNKVMILEVAPGSTYQSKILTRGRDAEFTPFAQTNHYILPGLERYNLVPESCQQTSYDRLRRVNKLMDANLASLNFAKFISMSFDTEAENNRSSTILDKASQLTSYQNNSIFRTWKKTNAAHHVSAMIIELPKDPKKPIRLYLRILEHIQDSLDESQTQHIRYVSAITTLDSAISHPTLVQYQQKICTRKKWSKICE